MKKEATVRWRTSIYALLARVYREELSPPLIRLFRSDSVQSVLRDMGIALGEDFLTKAEDVIWEELAIGYAALFVGPGRHIAPYESVHCSGNGHGMLCGERTITVNQIFESVGLELKPDYHDLPDHISVEFEYMSELTGREADAWAKSDECAARRMVLLENEFLHDHIITWVPSFCEQVARMTSQPFYREMAALTSRFLELEVEHIGSYLESRQATLMR